MYHIASRLEVLEQTVKDQNQKILDLTQRVITLEQRQWLQAGTAGGGGSAPSVYVVMAPSSGPPIAGLWSGSAPTAGGGFMGTVYQVSGTGFPGFGTIANMGTQQVINWMPSALVSGKACYCDLDAFGYYVVKSQSCI